MTERERFRIWIAQNGAAVSLTRKTGTTCPCTAERGVYDPAWHAANPGAENCAGREIISVTTTTVVLRAIMYKAQTQTPYASQSKEIATAIGEMQKDDMIMVGAIGTDNDWYDVTALDEESDTLEFNSETFVMRHVFPYTTANGALLAHICLLKRVD